MQPIPQPPIYASAATSATRHYALPASGQTVELAYRLGEDATEVRLTAAPNCMQETVEFRLGTQEIRHELSQAEKIIMWSAYAGAGLTAGLVGVGMARGRAPGRGLAILGMYGIPLGALGGYQSWRSRTLTESMPPEETVAGTAIVPCPPEQQDLLIYAAQEVTAAVNGPYAEPEGTLNEKQMVANRQWQPLSFQPPVPLVAKHGVIPLEPGEHGMIVKFEQARETEPEADEPAYASSATAAAQPAENAVTAEEPSANGTPQDESGESGADAPPAESPADSATGEDVPPQPDPEQSGE